MSAAEKKGYDQYSPPLALALRLQDEWGDKMVEECHERLAGLGVREGVHQSEKYDRAYFVFLAAEFLRHSATTRVLLTCIQDEKGFHVAEFFRLLPFTDMSLSDAQRGLYDKTMKEMYGQRDDGSQPSMFPEMELSHAQSLAGAEKYLKSLVEDFDECFPQTVYSEKLAQAWNLQGQALTDRIRECYRAALKEVVADMLVYIGQLRREEAEKELALAVNAAVKNHAGGASAPDFQPKRKALPC